MSLCDGKWAWKAGLGSQSRLWRICGRSSTRKASRLVEWTGDVLAKNYALFKKPCFMKRFVL